MLVVVDFLALGGCRQVTDGQRFAVVLSELLAVFGGKNYGVLVMNGVVENGVFWMKMVMLGW